jgi:hypothetical protein
MLVVITVGKIKEYTRKGGFLGDEWWETTVVDEKGNKGVGRDRDKQKSIEKAYKNLRERRGHY